jgi:hypothetical protein
MPRIEQSRAAMWSLSEPQEPASMKRKRIPRAHTEGFSYMINGIVQDVIENKYQIPIIPPDLKLLPAEVGEKSKGKDE